jgi:chemotaxis protein MotB
MSAHGGSKKAVHHEEAPHPAEDHGEGNWLVSYADMMTLLVGFFAILLSFASVDQEQFEKAKESITKEFGGTYERPYGDIADRLRKELEKAKVGDQVIIKTNDAGVEIAFLGTAFFESGSVDFKAGVKNTLDLMIPKIQELGSEFNIVIEGHTDDVPLSGGGFIRNNFELSSIRACRVLDYFHIKGFKKELMTAVGYGEARPVVPNRDQNGSAIVENQAQNRRVIIKMIKASAQSL